MWRRVFPVLGTLKANASPSPRTLCLSITLNLWVLLSARAAYRQSHFFLTRSRTGRADELNKSIIYAMSIVFYY